MPRKRPDAVDPTGDRIEARTKTFDPSARLHKRQDEPPFRDFEESAHAVVFGPGGPIDPPRGKALRDIYDRARDASAERTRPDQHQDALLVLDAYARLAAEGVAGSDAVELARQRDVARARVSELERENVRLICRVGELESAEKCRPAPAPADHGAMRFELVRAAMASGKAARHAVTEADEALEKLGVAP